jgi:signal transduction histidine kinase
VAVLDKVNFQLSKLSNLVLNLRQLFNTNQNDFQRINLTSTIHEIIEIIEPTIESKRIYLKQNVPGDLYISGDAIQIQQVIINLLNNAIDAIETTNTSTREIRITTSHEDDLAVLHVEDTGGGIDLEVLPSIFELYKTTKKDGLGIGLWLSKTIINRHHGNIFASNNPIGGAIFTIEIPLSHTHS